MLIGAHVSIQGGLHQSPVRAIRYGCECFQIFSRNQMQWKAPSLTEEKIRLFRDAWAENGRLSALIHDIYLVNLSSPNEAMRSKSCSTAAEELRRAGALGIQWIVIHPGSHLGAGEAAGLKFCADSLSKILKKTANCQAGILIETTAGQGNDLGHRLEHIDFLLNTVNRPENISQK
jgi:deoxyribonuclease-4